MILYLYRTILLIPGYIGTSNRSRHHLSQEIVLYTSNTQVQVYYQCHVLMFTSLFSVVQSHVGCHVQSHVQSHVMSSLSHQCMWNVLLHYLIQIHKYKCNIFVCEICSAVGGGGQYGPPNRKNPSHPQVRKFAQFNNSICQKITKPCNVISRYDAP